MPYRVHRCRCGGKAWHVSLDVRTGEGRLVCRAAPAGAAHLALAWRKAAVADGGVASKRARHPDPSQSPQVQITRPFRQVRGAVAWLCRICYAHSTKVARLLDFS